MNTFSTLLLAALLGLNLRVAHAIDLRPVPPIAIPKISALDQYGRKVKLRSFAGKNLIITVAAQWSEASVELAPRVQSVTENLVANGVDAECVTLLTEGQKDRPATIAEAAAWAVEHGLSGSVIHPAGQKSLLKPVKKAQALLTAVATAAGSENEGYPLLVFVNPLGTVTKVLRGAASSREIQDAIIPGLEDPAIPVIMPLRPAGLTLDLTYGETSGTNTDPLLGEGEGSESHAEFTSGNLPTEIKGFAFTEDRGDSTHIVVELLRVVAGTGPQPLPHDVPITITISGLTWSAAEGQLQMPFAGVFAENLVPPFIIFGRKFLPLAQPDGAYRVGPFTISELGAAPTDEVTTVLGAFVFERSDPLLGLLRLIRIVQTSRLPATKATALLVALQKALPQLAPNGDRTAALGRLEKFLSVLSGTKAKSLTPEVRAFFVDTVTELQAALAAE